MPDAKTFISFPEGYLGERPAKFPLLANHPGFFAINKPAGIACFQHEWNQGKADISMALRRELLNEKPQLRRLGIEGLFRIFKLDAELSGVLVYAKNEVWEDRLKNAIGSDQAIFRYHLLAETDVESREFERELPIAIHGDGKGMLVSHRTGRKCRTRFRYIRHYGRYQLWEASTRQIRPHQIRLYGSDSGLAIVGETRYGRSHPVYLSKIKRDFKARRAFEKPIYEHLCIHLVSVEFELPEEGLPAIHAPLPGRFATLLKSLERHRGGSR